MPPKRSKRSFGKAVDRVKKRTAKTGPKRRAARGNRRREPLWDLYRDGITYSMMSKFILCPERFRLSSVEGWSDSRLSTPLEYGNAFHECLENHSAGYPYATETVLSNYRAKVLSRQTTGPEEQQEIDRICGMVSVVFPRYVEFWREKDLEKQYVLQEQTFDVNYTLPSSGRTLRLRGKWDGAYQDQNGIWLQENKTKGDIDEAYLQASLYQDMQTMFYSLTLSRHFGYYPYGVLYNVCRRPGLRVGKTETLYDFIQRVADDVDKRPSWYFMRWETPIQENDMELFLQRSLHPLLEKICNWWESIQANPFDPWTREDGSPNTEHFLRPAGTYDSMGRGGKGEFFELLYRNSYWGIYQREEPFPELAEE